MIPAIAFDLALEHGRCVGIHLPRSDADVDALAQSELLGAERAFAAGLSPVRRRAWVGGRVAMRRVLVASGIPAPAVLADARGAPVLPAGITGSISHKETVAVALVAREERARIGVDLESDLVRTYDIASRVLTDDELEELAPLDAPARSRAVVLRFSAKEAIYKAIDPFVRRYVAFHEVSVTPLADGGATVRLRLREGEGRFAVGVRWARFDSLVLTTARVDSSGD